MITLTANIQINAPNPIPFFLGRSSLGASYLGESISTETIIDRKNIISIQSNKFERSDIKLPSFGIISNTANLEFNDVNGRFLEYANLGILKGGIPVRIFLQNTLVESSQKVIDVKETDTWDYDNDNRVASVSLKDDLEEWQDVNVGAIDYDPRNPEHKPFKWLYTHLWEFTNPNYRMLSFEELDTDTQNILQNTYTQYPLIKSGSLWEQWTKLCEVCQLHIYKDNNGVVVCRYNGGN